MTDKKILYKFSLDKKIIVITGGAGLIGKEISIALARAGGKVYIADIDKKKCKNIEKQNNNIKWVSLDVTNTNSIKKCINKIISNEKKIDVWINAAYPKTSNWEKKFEDIDHEYLKKNVDMHLNGYILCCQQIAYQMKKQGNGSIINYGSIYGVVGPNFSIYEGTQLTNSPAYSAIKGGIIAFTKYLANYYARYGIRANVICPGGIYNKQPKTFVKKYAEKVPLGRMGKTEDMIGPTIFLASDASEYITGHILMVDGGWTAW